MIVRGTAEIRLHGSDDIQEAEKAGLVPVDPGLRSCAASNSP